MRTTFFILSLVICFCLKGYTQTGTGTGTALSTLHNAGSFAGNYKVNPGIAYTLGDDYIVDYTNNVANTTYTLPSISAGTAANRNGRIYFIRNASSSNSLTVITSSSELINTSNSAVSSLSLNPGWSLVVVRNADPTGGTTWHVLNYGPIAGSSSFPSTTYIRKFYRSPGIVTNTVALGIATNSLATAQTLNKTSTGVSNIKNLLDADMIITTPTLTTIRFTAAIDDISTNSVATPIVTYDLEIFDTITGVVVTGTGDGTLFGPTMQLHGSWYANFTISGSLTLPPGRYNARLKAYEIANAANINLAFTSYGFVASYAN
ncbi:hypothetical protein [Pedobacter sandarakinus]|uniref:hypothetical protein n=1 Tax=Pedobacter sandarakinus TaxID=353156 RepID=UPI002245213F|nr:hypothetical protein [Pedobacter sandarakinus]MCX2576145.1 hypothetical protein [Pedobacter sandarakinus]